MRTDRAAHLHPTSAALTLRAMNSTTTPLLYLRRIAAVAVASTAVVALSSGCGPSDPTPVASATPTAEAVSEPAQNGADTVDVKQLLDDAGKSARILRSVSVQFSTTNIEDLLAKSYAAEVTTSPAVAARGSANLKINGKYSQTDFHTNAGNLWIKGADGKFTNAGTARGKFDPAVLLDPERGLAAIISGTTDAQVDGAPAKVNGRDTVKVTGQLPADAATVLVPKTSLGDAEKLPVTLWLSPEQPRMLVQVIIGAGKGSMTIKLAKADPFTTSPG